MATCDICDQPIVGEIQKACTTRPSDPLQLCSVMWVCLTHASEIGAHDDAYWERYAEENHLNYEG